MGEDEPPIARANQAYLYASDVEGVTKGLSGEDSVKVLKAFAEKWVRQQMLLQKAKENIPDDDPGIMRKIEDYRQHLTLYEYEKALIAGKLDTSIKATEVQKYYDEFGKNFPLQNEVHYMQYIKLNEDKPDFKDIRKLILSASKSDEDNERIDGYSKVNASNYAYGYPLWYSSESIKTLFQLSANELSGLQQSSRFKEFKRDDGTILFIRIIETKRKGDLMPIELARTDIAKILIEKRKMRLIEQTYERAYRDGLSSKKAEIFVD